MTNCQLNEIFLGEVASVQNYGAFIRIPGSKQQGLVHKSQVSSSHVDDVGEILQKGERVWCKIISVNDDGKIGLSMKLVNQGNGKDLDPGGVKQHQDEQRRKIIVPQEKKVIELQAVLNTTCSKCGTKGHLSKDCFSTPDGKKYQLLPEIDEEVGDKTIEQTESKEEKKTKPKKSKKSKKKKSRQKNGSSSDDSLGDDKKSKKKKKKKHLKKKKRKHNDGSSDDSEDDRPIKKSKH